mgnify:CR=1 FL=1
MDSRYIIILFLIIFGVCINPILFWSLVIAFIMVNLMADKLINNDDINIESIDITDEVSDTFKTILFLVAIFIFLVIAIFNFINGLF